MKPEDNALKFSASERAEQNVTNLRAYLEGVAARGETLPMENGRPNITAIADAAKVLRNVFYTNSKIKRMLAEFSGGGGGASAAQADESLAHAEDMISQKDQRILTLEQKLAVANAEVGELRKLFAASQIKLLRYQVIENELLVAGKRPIP